MDLVVVVDPPGDLPERRLGVRQRADANIVLELWVNLGDDGLREAAYRGG